VTEFSRPFLDMVEALRMGSTFASGRRAARAGHVRGLTVSSSLATAHVRDPDEPTSHRARIAVRAFGAAEWSRAEAALVAQARFAADLLAGRMPAGIEIVLAGAGLNLLPLSLDEIAMDCTCGRRPMPCVHVAAACYALAASFDTDPFGAFAWRGRPRDELLLRLRRLRGAAAVDAMSGPAEPGDADLGDPGDFWGTSTPAARPYATSAAVRADALLDQLEPPRLLAGGRPLTEVLRPAYRALASPDAEQPIDGRSHSRRQPS
jgi:uncharacterized Zn finger protein